MDDVVDSCHEMLGLPHVVSLLTWVAAVELLLDCLQWFEELGLSQLCLLQCAALSWMS